MPLKYGVIGTGALGGFYGGKLAQTGSDIHFLFRSDFDFVNENGLRIDSVKGDFHVTDVACYSSSSDMPKCDVILVCLKTTSNQYLPEILGPIVHEDTLVILIQNGLGVEEQLASNMPDLKIAGGLAFICAQKTGPGYIQHLDLGRLIIGDYSSQNQQLLDHVCADIQQAGVQAKVSNNLAYSRWQKLVWNVPFNGLTVVMNATTDQLLSDENTSKLALEMMLEVVGAANACGLDLEADFAHRMFEMTKSMTPYSPSMKLDYDHKRPMEIQTIYSNPVQVAKASGYEMKKVAALEKQLRAIEARIN
ncbi:putative 2-dehydropantoate 2-reductase [uncultured Sunxiuqinia sp.]|uniref:putative 2-dehydropantoate 2-reductase n=1 Tax=uncultured Sunxiuqinia sp. TaxID=1573825 RepID=UPI002AA69545|nr:putative 2-dehydropantoate 2-reductase [uncultured Sunxiuqinia sp.]